MLLILSLTLEIKAVNYSTSIQKHQILSQVLVLPNFTRYLVAIFNQLLTSVHAKIFTSTHQGRNTINYTVMIC